jgi:translation initiation factor IF-1
MAYYEPPVTLAAGYFLTHYEGVGLSRDDLIHLEGEVTRTLGGGQMEVLTDQGHTLRAVLSGRMKRYKIKVLVGDRVRISVSPYDLTHGLITYRLK